MKDILDSAILLAIVLTAVGFVLLHNGVYLFKKLTPQGKSSAYVNLSGGVVIGIAGILEIIMNGGNFSAIIYLLVAITYIYLGVNTLTGADAKPLGVYCGFTTVFLALGGIMTLIGIVRDGGTWFDWWMVVCWFMWAVLWGLLFVELAFDKKKLAKPVYALCFIQAFITGILPAIFIFTGIA
ncbi:MAG: AmiS/UreI family transporter [Firmicutes bacterium]|nr:AmiS/UreI family transporter [Bacillota bacterium]